MSHKKHYFRFATRCYCGLFLDVQPGLGVTYWTHKGGLHVEVICPNCRGKIHLRGSLQGYEFSLIGYNYSWEKHNGNRQ